MNELPRQNSANRHKLLYSSNLAHKLPHLINQTLNKKVPPFEKQRGLRPFYYFLIPDYQ